MNRRNMASVYIGRLLVLFFLPSVAAAAPNKPPHILFIMSDDYGWHDIGYHGSRIRTPNLDKLAYNGVRLENYYVQPICSPTRSQLLSGVYQVCVGFLSTLPVFL